MKVESGLSWAGVTLASGLLRVTCVWRPCFPSPAHQRLVAGPCVGHWMRCASEHLRLIGLESPYCGLRERGDN